ncbi:MAG TPA: NAD-dependent epimerase/dehydratase family protein [Anaerolineaceae bacterium]|jgi:dihydroflavonol-4-reductase|nr:NAD-dependent epimerase/dehydratase family protein [Anaerolineaceae bacterium]
MNILVTGSTGFIGAALCRALVEQGHQVRAFHRASSNLRLLDELPVEHAIGDLTRPETLAPALVGMEAVFHTAAMLGGKHDEPGRMYTVTVEGTRALLNEARRAGVRRVVHTSSVAALGVPPLPARNTPPLLMDETHTWNLRPDYWPYGYAKYLAELEVQRAVAEGLDVVMVNPAVVIGAGDIYRKSSSLVVRVAQRRLPMLTEGGINIVHIDDVVAGHLAALQRGQSGQRYILGGHNLSHQTYLQQIAAVVGAPAPTLMMPAALLRRMVLPIRLISSFIDLPFSPSTFRQAGYYFYVDMRKSRTGLGLPQPRPVFEAVRSAYDWFIQTGALEAPR